MIVPAIGVSPLWGDSTHGCVLRRKYEFPNPEPVKNYQGATSRTIGTTDSLGLRQSLSFTPIWTSPSPKLWSGAEGRVSTWLCLWLSATCVAVRETSARTAL